MRTMNERQKYGKLIADRRADMGIQAKELARLLGIASSTMSNIETGQTKYPPEPEFLRRIWLLLQLPMRTQLTALGYLDTEDQEPGVAYVIREDDPRKDLLDLLRDAPPLRIGAITDLASLWVRSSTKEGNAVASAEEPRNQPNTA